MKSEFSQQKELKETNKEVFDQLEAEIQEIKEKIGTIIAKKNEERENYYKLKYEYEVEQQEVRQIEFIQKRKEKLLKDKEYQEKRAEEERLKRSLLPNPYQDDIDQLTNLIDFCKA